MEISKKLLRSWSQELRCNGYWACTGSLGKPIDMQTCINCRTKWEMRQLVNGKLTGKQIIERNY